MRLLTRSPAELAQAAVDEQHAAQKPEELARLAEWLVEVELNPRVALELGVYLGGTLWLWRQLWPRARLLGLDLSPGPCEGCEKRLAHRDCPRRRIGEALGPWPRGRLLVANSHDSLSRARVEAWAAGRLDFLHIDADHSYEAARADFELYAPLVQPGGVIVLHDVAGEAFPGSVKLWRELQRSEPEAFLLLEGRDDWGGLGVVRR